MTSLDHDAVLWRHARAGELADDTAPLLVLMHGIGSHEGDLFSLVPRLPSQISVASLRAPRPWQVGHAWFDLVFEAGNPTPRCDPAQVDEAAEAIIEWLDGLAAGHPRLGLLGFSQGAAMALQVATRAEGHLAERLSCVVALSGLLPFDPDLVSGPVGLPAFVAIGDHDEVIGAARRASLEQWARANLAAEVHHYPIGHWVSPDELADLSSFVAAHLV